MSTVELRHEYTKASRNYYAERDSRVDEYIVKNVLNDSFDGLLLIVLSPLKLFGDGRSVTLRGMVGIL